MGDQTQPRVRLEHHGDRTVVIKTAADLAAREALAAEAAVLQSLRHPGVIELVGFDASGQVSELTTQYAGAMTLADYRPPDPGSIAGVVAALAALVADLHTIGLHHGRITADHVVLGPSRRPVLASLADAAPATADGRAADVQGLLDVFLELLGRCPEPSSRGARKHRRALDAAVSAWRDGGGGPTDLASALAGLPFAHLPGPGTDIDPMAECAAQRAPVDAPSGTRTWRHRVPPRDDTLPPGAAWRRWGIPVAVAGAALALTWWSAAPDGSPQAAWTTPSETPSVEEPDPTAQSVTSSDIDAGAPFPSCDDGTPRRGCDIDIDLVGHLVRVGDTWFAAGREGDVVAVGDWDCDGLLTPAVLRPASGDVFVFDSWAVGGDQVDVGPSWSAPGAVALQAEPDGECDRLRSLAADGSPVDAGSVGLP